MWGLLEHFEAVEAVMPHVEANMGLIVVIVGAVVYWFQSRRPRPTPVDRLKAGEPSLERKGLRLGRDYTWYVRGGRSPVVRINEEGRKKLQQIEKKKKRKRFHVFDDL